MPGLERQPLIHISSQGSTLRERLAAFGSSSPHRRRPDVAVEERSVVTVWAVSTKARLPVETPQTVTTNLSETTNVGASPERRERSEGFQSRAAISLRQEMCIRGWAEAADRCPGRECPPPEGGLKGRENPPPPPLPKCSRGPSGRKDVCAFLSPRASAFGLSPGLGSPGPLGRFVRIAMRPLFPRVRFCVVSGRSWTSWSGCSAARRSSPARAPRRARCICAASSAIDAAATFSSRYLTRLVPGIGTMSGPLCSSQAMRDLSRRDADRPRQLAHRLRCPHVGVEVLALVARVATPEVALGIFLRALDLAGQEAAAKRRERHQADAELAQQPG